MGIASVILGIRGKDACWLAGSALALPIFFLSGCMLAGQPPDDINIADAVPKAEPRSPFGNPPSYTALGRRYTVLASADGYVARGVASWYGPDFHGKRASSGEVYNMYSMTAAHPTLPLPSYVRVTNLENGRAAIVRINDRGPFKGDRIIDLSYSAARKLGIWQNGTAYVEVRAITPPRNGDDADRMMLAEAAPQASRPAPGPVIQRAPSADSLPAQSAAVGLVTTPLPASSAYASPQPVWQDEPRVALALVPASAESTPAAARTTPPPVPATIDYESSVAAASPPDASTETNAQIFIQVGAFSLFQNADSMRERLTPLGVGRMEILPSDLDNLYRLRLGPFADQGEALRIIAVLDGHGFSTHRMIQEPSTNASLGGVQKLNVQAF